jgi:hypothetical protein
MASSRGGIVNIENAPNSKNLNGAIASTSVIAIGTFLFCAIAVVYFYGLQNGRTLDPFRSYSEELTAVLRTALTASVLSSWGVWVALRGKRSFGSILLRMGLATQLSLTLYAILGWQPISDRLGPLNIFFPSTFFAEYNWLTFIFEVAPLTSIASSLLLYAFLRYFGRGPASAQSFGDGANRDHR